ncbi:MAG: DUF4330 domain-containing protein [Monoglobales bacterium]
MEKRKNRFNVVDIFIIIIAIMLAAAFAYYANVSLSAGSDTSTIRYTVAVEGFSEEFKDLVKVGDNVRNIERACEAGTVVAVTPAEPNIAYNDNAEEGTIIPVQVPGEYRFTVTVESPYTKKGSGYFIEQVEIKTGKKIALKTPGFAFSGIIMDIERSDG